MEFKFSKEIRSEIIDVLLKDSFFLDFFERREDIVSFLAQVFPLDEMPSTDSRHKNAYEDFGRHLILNDDWSVEYLLKERLDFTVIEDERFVRFIELLIEPTTQGKIDKIHHFVTLLTPYLNRLGQKFVLGGYHNKLPVYKFAAESGTIKDIPIDIKKNDIPFLSVGTITFAEKKSNHTKPEIFPSFVLTKDTWNDFHATTLHYLFYYPNSSESYFIGAIKIMKRGEKHTVLPEHFELLDETYCSLGLGEEFYRNLHDALGQNFFSILFALRDIAFFPVIYESFEEEEVFKTSLLREDKQERNARTVSYTFGGGDLKDRYKFSYVFQPKFASEKIEVFFPFTGEGDIPKRIIALIGKNGTGKTQLLSSLAKNLADKGSSLFFPKTPAFGKVLAVSYSVFDDFEIPSSDASFNYKYCGLKKGDGELLSEAELERRFYDSVQKIVYKKRITKLQKALLNFIDGDIVSALIQDDPDNAEEFLKINLADYSTQKRKLSSGQTILLYIVVEILAELRYDSLILFDEPETHLHPNAISELISVIYDLVEQFDSFCVIATHSPIIIQSLKSDSVYITEREEDMFFMRKIGTESFGENLSKITNDIFGNRDVAHEYKKIIQKLLSEGKNYEEIVSTLESDNVPLSLNAKVYIRSLIKTS